VRIPRTLLPRRPQVASDSVNFGFRSQMFSLPLWLSKRFCEIQSRLKGVALSVLASALGISIPYAVDVRKGKRVPHPRHWKTLAWIAGLGQEGSE